jgi:Domain of unknown function (DUF4365)
VPLGLRYSREKQLEDESRAELRLFLTGQIVRDKDPDIGIDLEIEFVNGEQVENRLLWVQVKGTEKLKPRKGLIPLSMKTRHLKYYEKCQLPVIIILWRKPEKGFYYLFAQRYIDEALSS